MAMASALPGMYSGLGLRHPLEPEGQVVQAGAGGKLVWGLAGSTEWVRAQWGQVRAGPLAHQALLAAVQALLQTSLCLSELILVQGLWPQLRLPGLKSESSLALPLTGIAFTVLILLTEEALAIEASHFIPWLNVS